MPDSPPQIAGAAAAPQDQKRKPARFLKALVLLVLADIVLVGLVVGVAWWLTRPQPFPRTEIFRGVFLTMEPVNGTAEVAENGDRSGGMVVMIEAHWGTEGVRLANRELSPASVLLGPPAGSAPGGAEVRPVEGADRLRPSPYRLAWSDWLLAGSGAQVLVNTCRYEPSAWSASWPGQSVWPVETVVAAGAVSHRHAHSYLLWWDAEGEAQLESTKPPSLAVLSRAVEGIGMQGLQLLKGRAILNSLGNAAEAIPRTFIGVDAERKVLYLLAFERVTGQVMVEVAQRVGVRDGGQVDSGDGSTLLVGAGAPGVLPHTGLRGLRPLGPVLFLYADPLAD